MSSAHSWEIVDLIARWVHVTAAIMWVGNSLLFNWMDRTLVKERGMPPGSIGTTWLLHSGAFYHVEKTLLGGRGMPAPLHWFKWQSYTTWLSGAVLLVAVYWVGGRAAIADTSRYPLTHGEAVAVGIGIVFGGVAFYELMQRAIAPKWPRLAEFLLADALITVVVVSTHVLNGRAAFLHVGAMLASIMASNVAMTIVPSQRELVKSVESSGSADPVVSARAKRVSIHNNYFTFPVIVLMVSSHFPSLYAGSASWAVLLLLIVGGAMIRHILNIRFSFALWRSALAAAIVMTALGIYVATMPKAEATSTSDASALTSVTFNDARHVIDRRCAACHSATPTDVTFGPAPAGVMFDTPEQIRERAQRILERAVVTKTMPPSNKTGITESERAILGAWIRRGAP